MVKTLQQSQRSS